MSSWLNYGKQEVPNLYGSGEVKGQVEKCKLTSGRLAMGQVSTTLQSTKTVVCHDLNAFRRSPTDL